MNVGDDEIVLMKGLKRFTSYTGYGHSFKFEGFFNSPLLPNRDLDVIVIDATIGGSSDLPKFIVSSFFFTFFFYFLPLFFIFYFILIFSFRLET